MADVKKTVEIALKVIGSDTSQIKAVTSAFEAVQKQVEKVKSTIDSVQASLNSIKSPTGLKTAVEGFKKIEGVKLPDLTNFSKQVGTLKTSMEGTATSVASLKKDLGSLDNSLGNTGIRVKSLSDKFKTVLQFRLISEVILQLREALTSGVTAIAEYDQALKNLQAITGATELETAIMGATILEVASKTRFSAQEIADGMVVIGQAGFTATEAVQAMQGVSDLATGTLTDMKTTVDLVTTTLRVFDIQASDTSEVVDVFANAVNRSKLTIDKLRVSMNYVGPIARDAGISFKELSAAMGTLANSGLRASTIGTGLRQVLSRLVDPNKALKKAAKEAGVSLADLDPRTAGMSAAMQNLNLVMDDTSTAFEIFGKRGASAALVLSKSTGDFEEMLETVQRQGTAAEQAEKQMEGLAVSFKNLKDKLGVLAIAIGKLGFTDAAKLIIDSARNIIDVLTWMVDSTFARVIVKSALVASALFGVYKSGILLVKLSSIIGVIKGISAAFVSTQLAAVGAATGITGVVAALGPIALVVGTVTAAIALMTVSMQESSEEASRNASMIASEYGQLSNRMNDYRKEIIRNVEGSEALRKENLDLRSDLLKVSVGYDEVSGYAEKAANSIDPLTGVIEEGSTAIQEYAEQVSRLQFESLTKAANLSTMALMENTNWWSRTKESAKDAFKIIGNIFDGDTANSFKDVSEAAHEFATRLNEGKVAFGELQDTVKIWQQQPIVTAQQESIIEGFDVIQEKANLLVQALRESNKVSLEGTVKHFEEVARASGASGLTLEAVVDRLIQLKEINEGSFDNIIEKWAKSADATRVSDFADEYERLGGIFEEQEREAIAAMDARKQQLISDLAVAKALLEQELSTTEDKESAYKRYYAVEADLLKEAAEVRKFYATSSSAQEILAIQSATAAYEQALRDNTALYENDLNLRYKYQAKIFADYQAKIAKIIQGTDDDSDYTEENLKYKNSIKKKQADFSAWITSQKQLEADRSITEEEAIRRIRARTLAFYSDAVEAAKIYRSEIDKSFDAEEYEKRTALVLKAERKLWEERAKITDAKSQESEDAEIARINNTNSIREALYKQALKTQSNAAKTLTSELKRQYEQDLISLADYYNKRRNLADSNAAYESDLLNKEIAAVSAAYDAKIAASNSEIEVKELKAEKIAELTELEQRLDDIEQKRLQTINNLTASETKETEAIKLKTQAILDSVQKRIDAAEAESDETSFMDKQQAELDAMDRKHAEELAKVQKYTNDVNTIEELLSAQRKERSLKEKEQQTDLFDYQLSIAETTYGQMSQAIKDLYDSGITESKTAFKAYQALAIAEAIINTYKAATGAYSAMASIPYVGPALGAVAAAAAVASGMAQIAQIRAASYAYGGKVLGPDMGPRADNVTANLTPGEHVIDRPPANYYGHDLFDAFRKMTIPRDSVRALAGLGGKSPRMSIPANNRRNYATGGMVTDQNINMADTKTTDTKMRRERSPQSALNIVNVIDPTLMEQYMASAAGQKVLINVMSENALSVKKIVTTA